MPEPSNNSKPAVPTWGLAAYLEEHYVPDGVQDYLTMWLRLNKQSNFTNSGNFGASVTLLMFEQDSHTQLYIFHSAPSEYRYMRSFNAAALDTVECYKVLCYNLTRTFEHFSEEEIPEAYEQFKQLMKDTASCNEHECILSVLSYRLELKTYEKYADSLWLIPVDGLPVKVFPGLILNQYRYGQRRLAFFTPRVISAHPILGQFMDMLTTETTVEKQLARLHVEVDTDINRLAKQDISYTNPLGWFHEKGYKLIDTSPWLGLQGVFDRTLREVHHFTGYNEADERSKATILEGPHKNIRHISKLIYTKPRTLILPDSFRLLQNLDTLVISADARVPEQLDIILSLKKLRWLVFWQPYTAAEIRAIIAKMEAQDLASLQEVWFSCTDCYLENHADGVVETQNLASLPPRYIIKDYQAIKRKFGLIE